VGLISSAHDLSDGGLAQALVEGALAHDVGVHLRLPGDPFVWLFSESAGRVLVTVPDADADRLVSLAERHGVPLTPLGQTGGHQLDVEGAFEVDLSIVRDAWAATLPAALS
jgi:phosphoribosylformylglycinamidine synthase